MSLLLCGMQKMSQNKKNRINEYRYFHSGGSLNGLKRMKIMQISRLCLRSHQISTQLNTSGRFSVGQIFREYLLQEWRSPPGRFPQTSESKWPNHSKRFVVFSFPFTCNPSVTPRPSFHKCISIFKGKLTFLLI